MAKVTLKNARISFPDIWEARAFGDSKPSFSAAFLLAKNDPQIEKINEVVSAAAKEKWGEKAEAQIKAIKAGDKTFIHDGDAKPYAGYEGNVYLNARSYTRPTIVDRDRSPLTEADGRIYAGCYVNAILDVWVQDNQYGKRINATLQGIQFLKDGEAFSGGRAASNDDFEDLSEGADDDDFI